MCDLEELTRERSFIDASNDPSPKTMDERSFWPGDGWPGDGIMALLLPISSKP